jgi:hypothetical protein
MRRRALLPVATLAAFAVMAPSCLSPTLPLPPPDAPDAISVPGTNGMWQISGDCVAGAIVTVFDTNTGRGVLAEDLAKVGTYTVGLTGTACDSVWVEQQTADGASTSEPTFFVLEAVASGQPVDPNACP